MMTETKKAYNKRKAEGMRRDAAKKKAAAKAVGFDTIGKLADAINDMSAAELAFVRAVFEDAKDAQEARGCLK